MISATPNGTEKCYLGIFPKSMEGVKQLQGDELSEFHKHTFEAHMFTDKELAVMDAALPHLEPNLGDTLAFYESANTKIDPKTWVNKMDPTDIFYYMAKIHPMIVAEMQNLALNTGNLVFDPACGHGTLLKLIATRFPQLRLMGSDLNQEMVDMAKRLNPDINIYKADAIESSQLGLEVNSIDLLIFSGLINKSVLTREEAEQIMRSFAFFSKDYGYVIATGKTFPWFSSEDPFMYSLGFWNLLCTKWVGHNFFPFHIWITPRKIWEGETKISIIPIISEMDAGPGVPLRLFV